MDSTILYMSEVLEDRKIRIVRTHSQGTGGYSTEFIIPKEICDRYDITRDVHLMLIPEEDHFKVIKLRILARGEELKE
jgi:hypothetical protein